MNLNLVEFTKKWNSSIIEPSNFFGRKTLEKMKTKKTE